MRSAKILQCGKQKSICQWCLLVVQYSTYLTVQYLSIRQAPFSLALARPDANLVATLPKHPIRLILFILHLLLSVPFYLPGNNVHLCRLVSCSAIGPLHHFLPCIVEQVLASDSID